MQLRLDVLSPLVQTSLETSWPDSELLLQVTTVHKILRLRSQRVTMRAESFALLSVYADQIVPLV